MVLIAAASAAWLSPARACNVPVFRYALERWRPDPYRIVLFHRGPLTADERAILLPLEEQHDKQLGNFELHTVDVAKMDDEADREMFAALKDPPLPWLVVQYPRQARIPAPVWAGPLDGVIVASLVESPVRTELSRRLADGQTAVWLFLESGQPEKDDVAAKLVEAEIKKLEQELKLPVLSDAPDDELQAGPPLRIAFSLLRVPHGNAAEKMLVDMLRGSEPDLAERTDPLVFPIFGRGRALFALVGAGITAENIVESGSFLVGPCSCQIKELNPGFDLLLSTDWEALLYKDGAPPLAIASQNAVDPATIGELVPIPSAATQQALTPAGTVAMAQAAPTSTTALRSSWLLLAIGVVALLAIVSLAAAFRPKSQGG